MGIKPTKAQRLRAKIKQGKDLYGLTNKDMGVLMHLSERQWDRYLSDIENMKVGHLLKLEKILKTDFLEVDG